LLELAKGETIGEAETDDTDTFEDTVAAQLLKHERGFDDSRLLHFVGNDATNKVGARVLECGEQSSKLLLQRI